MVGSKLGKWRVVPVYALLIRKLYVLYRIDNPSHRARVGSLSGPRQTHLGFCRCGFGSLIRMLSLSLKQKVSTNVFCDRNWLLALGTYGFVFRRQGGASKRPFAASQRGMHCWKHGTSVKRSPFISTVALGLRILSSAWAILR